MPKLGLGLSLPQTRPSGGFSPKKISDLSLWLKADAGVATTPETFVSQITLSGAGESTSNGIYTRTTGGDTQFNGPNGNYIYLDGFWYLYDTTQGRITYYNPSFIFQSDWYIEDPEITPSPAPTASYLYSPTGNLVVSSWADQSGNGNDAITSAGNPQLTASAINGKPAIQFNNVIEGGFAYMIISSQFNLKNSSCFVVVKQNSTAYTFFARMMAFLPSSGEDYNSDDGMAFLFNNFNTRLQLDNNSNSAFSSNNQANGVFAITSYTINSSGLGKVFYNGIEGDGNFQNGSMSSQNGGNVYIAQGSQLAGMATSLDGEIAEIIIYNRAITTQERQQVEAYLNTKYAIY